MRREERRPTTSVRARVCPRCGLTAPLEARLCPRCYHPLSNANESTVEPLEASASSRLRAWSASWRVRVAVLAMVAAAAMTWWIGRGWFEAPPPPFPPRLGTRSIAAPGDTWPSSQGALSASRETPADLRLDGDPAWIIQLPAAPTTPLVANEEAVYVGLESGQLVAIDAVSGATRWSIAIPGVLDAAPVVAGDRLFVGFRSGVLAAIDASTGATVWEARLGVALAVSPTVVDGIVFATGNGVIGGFDAEDGSEIWRQTVSDSVIAAAPAVEGATLVVVTYRRVLVFDRTNGAQRSWVQLSPQHAPFRSVAIAADTIVAVSDGQVIAIDSAMRRPWWDGVRPLWEWMHLLGAAPNPPWRADIWVRPAPGDPYAAALDAERALLSGRDGEVVAVGLNDGSPRWSLRGPPPTAPPVRTPAGFVLASAHLVRVLDAALGNEIERYPLGFTAVDLAVAADGTYLLSERGEVVAWRAGTSESSLAD